MASSSTHMSVMDPLAGAVAKSDEHDLNVTYAKLLDASRTGPRHLVEQHAGFVYETARRAPLDLVQTMWKKAVTPPRNPEFALAVARAAPVLITRGTDADVATIYELLSETLSHVPQADKTKAADALLRAVLRVRGPVPPPARSVIRAHRETLQQYPDVWRLIGGFAA